MSKNERSPARMGLEPDPNLEENAMKTLSRFVTKFTSLIVAVLSCFDRVIFKGYLPITNGPALEGFVDHVLKIRRCDFMAFAEEQSETLVDSRQTPGPRGRRRVPLSPRLATARTNSSTSFCDSDRSAKG